MNDRDKEHTSNEFEEFSKDEHMESQLIVGCGPYQNEVMKYLKARIKI